MTVLGGADAGGSHTEAVIGTPSLAELSRVRGPPGRVSPGSVRDAADAIVSTVRQALERAATDEPLRILAVGAAGTGREDDQRALREALRRSGIAEDVLVTSDAVVALESAFPDGEGVLLIAGTGSIAYARDVSGSHWRVGGLGWRFGDEGSGYSLGRAGLAAAVAGHEGRGPATSLEQHLTREVGVSSMDHLPGWMRSADVAAVAALARTVCDVAETGDEVAAALVAEAARALVEHVTALLRRLPSGEVPLALAGGLIQSDTPVRRRLLSELATQAPRVRLSPVGVDPALGALRLAAQR
jgi:N-acetylglucosamine kinase-like BadF-type ATPase